MISNKKHVQQLASLLQAKGITDVVLSPGSRNGPLINTLATSGRFNCRSIVDERSAAYFALGLSQKLKHPVALVCSSGTATLNYAPAVAEAFYLNIPLVVITADRPGYRIDQGENQTIRQQHIYTDFCKKEINLPLGESEKELWYAGRIINEALNTATSGMPGPVHINVPLEEPLHERMDEPLPAVKNIEAFSVKAMLTDEESEKLAAIVNDSQKILILSGQQPPSPDMEKAVARFATKTGAVVLKEHLSNLHHQHFTGNIDTLITSLLSEKPDAFRPDLLITFGGTFVSKPLIQFLRKNKPAHHWHLSLAGQYYDTYQSLTRIIEMEAIPFFQQLTEKVNQKNDHYHSLWKAKEKQVRQLRDEFIDKAGFCDLTVFSRIFKSLPEQSVLHLGNSSPVRYALICDAALQVQYYGNRGTSGIDGSLSTAVGFASASKKINTVIVGDLSFFYDSNALWNNYIGSNFRIIVIHNGGGNIFSMIKGPSESTAFDQFFFTKNTTSAAGIAGTFGLGYFKATNEQELEAGLQQLYSPNSEKATLLEIFTDAELNAKTFRELFSTIKDA